MAVDDAPTVVRFPQGSLGPLIPALRTEDGYDVLAECGSQDVLIVSIGAFADLCIDVSERLRAQGIGVLAIDPRWVKPVHRGIIDRAAEARLVVVVEDGVVTGGVGSAIAEAMREAGITVPMRTIGVPDRFLDHGRRAEVLVECGLTAQDISRGIVEDMARMGNAGPAETNQTLDSQSTT